VKVKQHKSCRKRNRQ